MTNVTFSFSSDVPSSGTIVATTHHQRNLSLYQTQKTAEEQNRTYCRNQVNFGAQPQQIHLHHNTCTHASGNILAEYMGKLQEPEYQEVTVKHFFLVMVAQTEKKNNDNINKHVNIKGKNFHFQMIDKEQEADNKFWRISLSQV